jgi:phage-related protein
MDQGGTEGIRDVPRRSPVNLPGGLDDCRRGGKADIAKPMHGMGSGVFEIALPFRGDAFRVVYAVQLAEEIWVVHTFQKKSTQGIETPKREVDLIKDRLKRLKEMLR